MAQYVDCGERAATTGGADVARYLRVSLATGVAVVAGLARAHGVTRMFSKANEPTTIILPSKAGTMPMVAGKAISAGAEVYGAADGKVSDVQGTGAFWEGTALTGATADGDVIEVLPARGETAGS